MVLYEEHKTYICSLLKLKRNCMIFENVIM